MVIRYMITIDEDEKGRPYQGIVSRYEMINGEESNENHVVIFDAHAKWLEEKLKETIMLGNNLYPFVDVKEGNH